MTAKRKTAVTEDLRAVGYIRVSTAEQATADKPSLDQQREGITAQCVAKGYELVETYVDVESGAKSDRPALQQMLADAATGAFGRVVFLKTDRLGRNTKDLLNNADALHEFGVDLVSVRESFDTSTPSGMMFFQLLGIFAEFERTNIIARGKDGRHGSVEKHGTYMASVIPFGYRKNGKQIVPDETEADVVRGMFNAALTDGMATIAARLCDDGIPPRLATSKHFGHKGWSIANPDGCKEVHSKLVPWHASTVQRIVTNPRYIGKGQYNEKAMPCEALVDAETFYAVQDALTNRKRLATGKPRDDLLRGLVRCRRCGGPGQGKSDKGVGYYVCGHRRGYGAGIRQQHAGVQRRWLATTVDFAVRKWSADLLRDPAAALKRAKVAADGTAADKRERDKARAKAAATLTALDAERTRAVTGYTKGVLSEAELDDARTRIDARADEARAALAPDAQGVDASALAVLIQQVVDSQPEDQAALVCALRARGLTVTPVSEQAAPYDAEWWGRLVRSAVSTVWLEDDGGVTIEGVLSASTSVSVNPRSRPRR